IKIAKTAIAAKTDIELNQNIRIYILIVRWKWAHREYLLMPIFDLLSNPIPKTANYGNFVYFQALRSKKTGNICS
ncbi:MAG: hypothetical protein ACK5P3_10585, partial [Dolichospermum sp.]